MKDPRLEEARRLYTDQQPQMVAFKTHVEISIKLALAERRIAASVTGRVKALDSILKKLISKPHHTFLSLSDKIGFRIITNDVTDARTAIRSNFVCLSEEDKATALGADRLGYPGVHYDIVLKPEGAKGTSFDGLGFRAEVQIRTHAQHAWCEISHRFDYKNDTQQEIPAKLKRRLMLTVGLLEVADMNLDEIAREMNALPAFKINRLLASLEGLYFLLTARAPDRELSLSILGVLSAIYPGGPEELQDRVQKMFEAKKPILRAIFERNERLDEPRSALFFQPETLAVCELLEDRREALFEAWGTILPEEELFLLANEFGYGHDELTSNATHYS